METVVRVPPLAILALVLCGCAEKQRQAGPCEGLVYSDAGLDRRAYAPCARAMVAELDTMQRAVQTFRADGLTKMERIQARQGCFAAGARLSRLIGLAGGKTRLLARWDDVALNKLNWEILAAKDEYTMRCYYGLGKAPGERGTPNHADAQRILAELR